MLPLVLTIQETANFLRVHRATVSRMISAGELPCIRVRSRKLIREQDVRAFIDSQIGMTGESS
ncbi:helix-turn-helix domain-containing protein [Pseudodesulfovibrio sp. S3-i]|uniref:helix-turn-helix domain-containing protein n=1 Tax=Pseudodesulfovibrio sp. S3-i TaxID=2929474 RepID=UPI0038B4B027